MRVIASSLRKGNIVEIDGKLGVIVSYLEATRLAGFDPAEARRFFGRPPAVSATMERDFLKPWPAETAQMRYFERVNKLAGV